MNKKKISFIILLILLVTLFSACNLKFSGNSYTDTPKTDQTGQGLEVTFKIYDKNNMLKTKKQLLYELNLKNSGIESITLKPENIKLKTNEIISSISKEYPDIFTDETLNLFYEKIFSNTDLILYHDQEKKISGILALEPNFDTKAKDTIEYTFDINYDYTTKFFANLELKQTNGIYETTTNTLQAAPIQINKIELIPAIGDDEYYLTYHIYDKGQRGSLSPATTIKNLDLTFRTSDISSSCTPRYEKSSSKPQDIIIRTDDNLILECPITLDSDEGDLPTQTSGSFSYNYALRITGTINLPKET